MSRVKHVLDGWCVLCRCVCSAPMSRVDVDVDDGDDLLALHGTVVYML